MRVNTVIKVLSYCEDPWNTRLFFEKEDGTLVLLKGIKSQLVRETVVNGKKQRRFKYIFTKEGVENENT